ncbi:hypothetical protein Golomagni_02191 [Golovinomyces magnicellulatus]|nr:hypothetical protein Golomagni_02191 [Golovinomyces magnicellulatus]
MKDIKYSKAVNFLQFCKDPKVEIHRVTWDELENAEIQKPKERWNELPELDDDDRLTSQFCIITLMNDIMNF